MGPWRISPWLWARRADWRSLCGRHLICLCHHSATCCGVDISPYRALTPYSNAGDKWRRARVPSIYAAAILGSWQFQAMTYLDAKTRARLPNSAFAYVDSRGRRRLPINDEAHVRNALSRFNQATFENEAARDRARPRLLNAAKKYGIVPVGFITGQLQNVRIRGEIEARASELRT